jgi:hypothetical protein
VSSPAIDEPTEELNEARPEDRRGSGSLRFAMWIGIILAPLVCVWVFRSEILYNSADLASSALSFAAVGALLILVGMRVFIRSLDTRRIILIYAAVAGTVGISTMGMVQFLITTLAAPFWFANPVNRWQEFWSAIPSWAAPRSPDVVRGFFLGHASLYAPAVWHAWVTPVIAWSIFIAALLVAQYCIAHLMYPRWANEERLAFPIVQIPLTVTEAKGSARTYLIAGALVAIAIQGMNALHVLKPAIPELRVLPIDIGATIPPPWNGIGVLWVTFYPCIIGLSMLVPTNILLSSVFFYALSKGENLAGHMWGLHAGSPGGVAFPYSGEQAQGAVLALALVVIWSARHTLRRSFSDPTSRLVWAAFVISMLIMLGYGIALGLHPATAILFFGLFMVFMISVGWLRAAVGLIWNLGNDVSWWARAFMTGPMTMNQGVGLAYLRWFSFGDFRAHALPTYVDMMRLTDAAQIRRRRLVIALAVGSLLSIIASLWVALDVYYRYGAASALTDQWRTYQGRVPFDMLRSQLDGTVPPLDMPRILAVVWGVVFTFGLQVANLKLMWWPFHPAGFVMAQTGALEWFWCPMLIAAVIKTLIMRIGGLKLYRRAIPFFIGLVLGDYAIAIVLTILGWLLHTPMYKPFPI